MLTNIVSKTEEWHLSDDPDNKTNVMKLIGI